MTRVSDRMAEILKPGDVVPPEPVVEPMVGRSMDDGLRPVESDPALPIDVAERIREALRRRDLEAAAEIATLAMNSLGIDVETAARASPEGVEEPVHSGDTTV